MSRAAKKRGKPNTPCEKTRLLRERTNACRRLLAAGCSDVEIRVALGEKYGVAACTIRRDLVRARKERAAEFARSSAEHALEAYEFYRSIVQNRAAKDADRLRAQDQLNRLQGVLGDAAPATHEGGGDVELAVDDLTDEELAILVRFQGQDDPATGQNSRRRTGGTGKAQSA